MEHSDFIKFISESHTPYHAIEESISRLSPEHSVSPLQEAQDWSSNNDTSIYFFRKKGSLFIFKNPSKDQRKDFALKGIVAHLDSPCLKLKPNPLPEKSNLMQWGVELYGSPILHSFLNQDLFLAGKVAFKEGDSIREEKFELKDFPLIIPALSIHLQNQKDKNKPNFNPQSQFTPLFSLLGKSSLDLNELLTQKIKKNLNLKPHQHILAMDAYLVPHCSAKIGGFKKDLIFSPRLDDLFMVYASLMGFLNSLPSKNDKEIPFLAFLNHEEVGSLSSEGARSNFLETCLSQLLFSKEIPQKNHSHYLSQSMILSGDMAHGHHPQYSEQQDQQNSPQLGMGPALKFSASNSYMGDLKLQAHVTQLGKEKGIPLQTYCNRADKRGGSTIGPFVASSLGASVLDIGGPMLSMHSSREIAALQDLTYMISLCQTFFEETIS